MAMKERDRRMVRQYKYMGIGWKVNAEGDVLEKMGGFFMNMDVRRYPGTALF